MTAKSMMPYVEGNSAIRAMFEEGARMAALYGKENVYDFSLGNPSVPAPDEVNQAIHDILEEEHTLLVHGYNQSKMFEQQGRFINNYRGQIERGFDASNCVQCGACEAACPQHLSIIDWLQTIDREYHEIVK